LRLFIKITLFFT